MNEYYPARWWTKQPDEKILCTLCPRYCKIGDGQPGFCYIRQNWGGELITLGYGHPTGFAVDPIEKKPLSHFLPGSGVLSFGTAGCNLGCKFCQNWHMSKAKINDMNALDVSPEQVVQLAIRHQAPSIAYTYNDPTIFAEYVVDVSRIARANGIRNVMVTAGYIDKNARPEVYQYIDAANVDLKAFSENFYHKLTFSHLKDVLETLKWIRQETDIWLEITTLLIPGENDSAAEINQMCDWITAQLGDEVPLHFTAFHPDFKMSHHPPTPHSTLKKARKLAISAGIKYCYVGNVFDSEGQTTYCPGCGSAVIRRDWHTVSENRLRGNLCPDCGSKITGVFK